METNYRVVFSGNLLAGSDPVEASKKIAADFGMSLDQAEKLVTAGQRVIVKKDIDQKTGEIICRRLAQAGLEVELVTPKVTPLDENSRKTPIPSAAPPKPSPRQSASKETGAGPVSSKTRAVLASSANPYAAPAADLDRTDQQEEIFGDPRKVSAGRGWKWLTDAYGIFKERPWPWIGAFILMYFLAAISNFVPIIGTFISYFLFPVFFGGMMLGAQAQYQGGWFRFNYLFAGFSNGRNQLLLLGVLMTLGFLASAIPMLLFFGVSIFTGDFTPETFSGGNVIMIIFGILASLALSIPLYMAIWFSTPLITVNGYNAWPSMKLSFQACRKNIWPFMLYGLVLLLFSIVSMVIFGIGMAMVAPMLMGQNGMLSGIFIVPVVMMIVLLPALVIVSLSIYTGYRDLFYS